MVNETPLVAAPPFHYLRSMSNPVPPTLGLVLAGGLARRMGGGDKARIEIGGVTILD